AQRLADAEHVGDVRAGPELADPAEARVDRVDDEQGAGFVAAAAQRPQDSGGRDARAGAPLHGLDDRAGGAAGQRTRVLTERAAVHTGGQALAPPVRETP